MKIKKGDNVIVIAGKDKGKTGTIEQTFPKTEQVRIDGVKCENKASEKQAYAICRTNSSDQYASTRF